MRIGVLAHRFAYHADVLLGLNKLCDEATTLVSIGTDAVRLYGALTDTPRVVFKPMPMYYGYYSAEERAAQDVVRYSDRVLIFDSRSFGSYLQRIPEYATLRGVPVEIIQTR